MIKLLHRMPVLPYYITCPCTAAMVCCHSWHAPTVHSPTGPSSLSQMVWALQAKRASI